jgi:hypothetical protein
MRRRRFIVLLVLTLLIGGGACLHLYLRKSPIERQFDRIIDGMTPSEVHSLLGEGSSPLDTEPLGSPSFTGDCWETADGTIFVVYENGRVIEKGWVSSKQMAGPMQKLLDEIVSLFR